MRRVPVESSSIDSVGYEKDVLEVRFRNGGLYQYFHVPELMFELLMEAESKGRFFNENIRSRYEGVRLERGRTTVAR
jgi:KTSC domain